MSRVRALPKGSIQVYPPLEARAQLHDRIKRTASLFPFEKEIHEGRAKRQGHESEVLEALQPELD